MIVLCLIFNTRSTRNPGNLLFQKFTFTFLVEKLNALHEWKVLSFISTSPGVIFATKLEEYMSVIFKLSRASKFSHY